MMYLSNLSPILEFHVEFRVINYGWNHNRPHLSLVFITLHKIMIIWLDSSWEFVIMRLVSANLVSKLGAREI